MALRKFLPSIIIVVLPVMFALTLPFFFKLQLFTEPQQLVSILGMLLLPFSEGFMLIATSSVRNISRPYYRVFMPWVPLLLFFLVTFLFQLEDCACWIIGLPIYLLLSSIGGLTAGYFRLKKLHHPPGGEISKE